MDSIEDPLEKFRQGIISRGSSSMLSFGSFFRKQDNDGSGTLSKDECAEAVKGFGMDVPDGVTEALMSQIDEDESGQISYEELIKKIRPEMSVERLAVIEEAFTKLDESGDGVLTVEDLKDKMQMTEHPMVKSEETTEDELWEQFLSVFDNTTKEDGKVTKEEFLDYYSVMSKMEDDDELFIEQVKMGWAL
ncbi:unnamed protein product [Meganyctiphanes norvegica]|uniref:EF-hand domain-containing protein n=1 Tax=Meganyctiphanes norvegica TaxID=48144 RepID=A0AAV2RTA0_MEGNR